MAAQNRVWPNDSGLKDDLEPDPDYGSVRKHNRVHPRRKKHDDGLAKIHENTNNNAGDDENQGQRGRDSQGFEISGPDKKQKRKTPPKDSSGATSGGTQDTTVPLKGDEVIGPGISRKKTPVAPKHYNSDTDSDIDFIDDDESLLQQEKQDENSESKTIEMEDPAWNTPMTVTQEDDNSSDSIANFAMKAFKLIMIVAVFIFIFCGAILSKMTVLLAAVNAQTDTNLYCVKYNTSSPSGSGSYAQCVTVPDGKNVSYPGFSNISCLLPKNAQTDRLWASGQFYHVCDAVAIRWIWSLTLILLTPEIFIFLRNLVMMCFKKEKTPSVPFFIVITCFESLQTIGVCLFTFRVLPKLPSIIHGVILMTGIAVLPAFLKLISRPAEENRRAVKVAADTVAFLAQVTAMVFWPIISLVSSSDEFDSELNYTIPISVLLMSFSLWFNYVDQNNLTEGERKHWRKYRSKSRIFSPKWLRDQAHFLRKSIQTHRTKLYLGIAPIKILLILGCMTLFMFSDYGIQELWDLTYDDKNCGVGTIGVDLVGDAKWDWLKIWALNTAAGLICYISARNAAKVWIQAGSYALSLTLVTPCLVPALLGMMIAWQDDPCWISDIMPGYIYWHLPSMSVEDLFVVDSIWIGYIWWASQIWLTLHIWKPKSERLAKTSTIFLLPLWNNVTLEQWLLYNRNRHDNKVEKNLKKNQVFDHEYSITSLRDTGNRFKDPVDIPMIYLCATMWHETDTEMQLMLKSIYKLDEDQGLRRNVVSMNHQVGSDQNKAIDPDYYEFEGHIFFDDAMKRSDPNDKKYKVNDYVILLVKTMQKAVQDIYGPGKKVNDPVKIPTPYGGQLIWTLPGGNKLVAHLKDKSKIKIKKRWSQVMYMYYFLTHKLLGNENLDNHEKQIKAENTFLMALDGDVDFEPKAVSLLVDLMRKDPGVGAACGRIHPTGSGPMVWYQKFEYALGHWMQKATEHVFGSVLCSPGCFSLFRANALMDDNVMHTYTSEPSNPFQIVQYDQGEDRWLCTLLLKQGWRVEYCAASDAFTFAPEGFEEFYKQRKRWAPSTMANILDLIKDWRKTVKNNENISKLYIFYQTFLFGASLIGTGTIFLMIVDATRIAIPGFDEWTALALNLTPLIIFIILCYTATSATQIKVASVLTVTYALIQMIVLVGVIIQIVDEPCSPNALFFYFVAGSFILAGVLHPQEILNLVHGFIYFLSIPSMYMLLTIYAITNMNDLKWGTREAKVTTPANGATTAPPSGNSTFDAVRNLLMQAPSEEKSGFNLACGDFCSCLLCPRTKEHRPDPETIALTKIVGELGDKVDKLLPQEDESEEKSKSKPKPSFKDQARRVQISSMVTQRMYSKDDSESDEPEIEVDEMVNPPWLKTKGLGNGATLKQDKEETKFFEELIKKYLPPPEDPKNNAKKKKEIDDKKKEEVEGLLKLRNEMSFGFFLLNAIFVVFVFTMQMNAGDPDNPDSGGIYISWPNPCGDGNVALEPIGFMFLLVYGVIILIQVVGMLLHRAETLMHIVSTTSLRGKQVDNAENLKTLYATYKVEQSDEEGHTIAGESSDDDDDDNGPSRKKSVLTMEKRALQSGRRKHSVGSVHPSTSSGGEGQPVGIMKKPAKTVQIDSMVEEGQKSFGGDHDKARKRLDKLKKQGAITETQRKKSVQALTFLTRTQSMRKKRLSEQPQNSGDNDRDRATVHQYDNQAFVDDDISRATPTNVDVTEQRPDSAGAKKSPRWSLATGHSQNPDDTYEPIDQFRKNDSSDSDTPRAQYRPKPKQRPLSPNRTPTPVDPESSSPPRPLGPLPPISPRTKGSVTSKPRTRKSSSSDSDSEKTNQKSGLTNKAGKINDSPNKPMAKPNPKTKPRPKSLPPVNPSESSSDDDQPPANKPSKPTVPRKPAPPRRSLSTSLNEFQPETPAHSVSGTGLISMPSQDDNQARSLVRGRRPPSSKAPDPAIPVLLDYKPQGDVKGKPEHTAQEDGRELPI